MAKKPGDRGSGRDELEALFQQSYRKVVYYFVRAGFTAENAKDAAQETFYRASRGWDDFRGDASRETWLYEIARNIYKNSLRDGSTLKRQGVEVSIDSPSSGGERDERAVPELPATQPDPEWQAMRSEDADRLGKAIARLPDHRRRCVELRLLDLQYDEIAGIMGISIETVKSHLYQARESLRKSLGGSD